jgi:F420-dependent oxidoreductase-like protein
MEICLMVEGQEDVTWEQWTSLALACEEFGFDALFRSDHYLSFGHPTEYGSMDAWATLAALAPITQRIRLGTLVSPVTFRHPSNLAKVVVTVDHASAGRVELGMGAGWFEAEHMAYGFPFPPVAERFAMLEEQVEIVHRAWDRDEDAVTFQGTHYQLQDCHVLPKPVQDPHPPLIIGGDGGPRSLRLASRWADEYNVNGVGPDRCREVRAALSRASEAEGRDAGAIRLSLMTTTLVAAGRTELEARVGRLLEGRGDTSDPADWIERVRAERIVGTVPEVLERLQAFADAGIERVMMQHLLHTDLEALALIGREVIPEAAGF